MKLGQAIKITSYRRLGGMTLLLMSGLVIVASIFTWSPVSARQAAVPSAPAAQASDHPEFPAGQGREAVMRLCSRCHTPNIILANGQDRTGWENTITKMARLGATGSDDDFSDIADYLTANFPASGAKKVFVNLATYNQLASVLEISDDDAKAIVAYRDKIKGFNSIDDMEKVPGVDVKKIEAKKDSLIFGSVSVKPAAN